MITQETPLTSFIASSETVEIKLSSYVVSSDVAIILITHIRGSDDNRLNPSIDLLIIQTLIKRKQRCDIDVHLIMFSS